MRIGQEVRYVFHGKILRAEIIEVRSPDERMIDLLVFSGDPEVGRPHGCVKQSDEHRHNTWHPAPEDS